MLVALLAISAVHGLAANARAGEADDPVAVISDTGASLVEVALHYDPDLHDRLGVFYASLFAALPLDVRVQVVCPNQAAVQDFEHHWGSTEQARGRMVRVVSMDRPITIWARDRRIARYFPATCRPAPTLMPTRTGHAFEHARNDLMVGDHLRSLGMLSAIVRTALCVEGGNIVANNRDAFVGTNVLSQNSGSGFDTAATQLELRTRLGRPIIFLGQDEGRVPWPHVDYYVTPIDDESVLVAGTVAGHALESGEQEVRELLRQSLFQRTARGDADSWTEDLDAVAEQLTRHGYRVQRLPMLRDPDHVWAVTYNNVVMERRDTRRIVYMPVYRIPALDQAAATIYRDRGFEVREIDVSTMFRFGGAVRCLVNVLERQPPAPLAPPEHQKGP